MIHKNMFKKANYYYTGGLISFISRKPDRIIVQVGDEEEGMHTVILDSKGYLRVNCDCTHGSVKAKYNVLCSHGLAVLMEMVRLAK